MKLLKAVTLVLSLSLLSACAPSTIEPTPTNGETSYAEYYGKKIDAKKGNAKWDGKVEVDVYILGIDKMTKEYEVGFAEVPKNAEVVAVRYEFKNISDKPINLFGLNLGNAGFDNPEKPLGSLNYSESSLHSKLGFASLPDDWSTSDKWILEPSEKQSISLDWIVENKDLVMLYSWLMPFEKDYKQFKVDLKP